MKKLFKFVTKLIAKSFSKLFVGRYHIDIDGDNLVDVTVTVHGSENSSQKEE